MKIGYLGVGSWGFCLASLLAGKGHELICWTTKDGLAKHLNETREHPLLPGHRSHGEMFFTTDISKALHGVDFLIESVTSAGLRPVLNKVLEHHVPKCPIVITSKGIEQNTGKILTDVAIEILGEPVRARIGCLSGPSYAQEVIRGLPTAVVGSAYNANIMNEICDLFGTNFFRVYPNPDIKGVAFGGALKNIIAIACGIAEGLGLGFSSRAALMTRGLNEMRKLAVACGCKGETLNGLSGLGDLCVTCSSMISRNYRFGYLIAEGYTPEKAQEKIGMVVEGLYTCVSALQIGRRHNVSIPIIEVVHKIVYEGIKPMHAVEMLMKREIKEETS